jgi:hypothetical protein
MNKRILRILFPTYDPYMTPLDGTGREMKRPALRDR